MQLSLTIRELFWSVDDWYLLHLGSHLKIANLLNYDYYTTQSRIASTRKVIDIRTKLRHGRSHFFVKWFTKKLDYCNFRIWQTIDNFAWISPNHSVEDIRRLNIKPKGADLTNEKVSNIISTAVIYQSLEVRTGISPHGTPTHLTDKVTYSGLAM